MAGASQNGAGVQPVGQPHRERHEVVGDLLLGHGVGAQSDDRQDAEQTHPEPDSGATAGQHAGDRHDPDVERDVGQHQVTPEVAAVVDADDQQTDGDQIGGNGNGEIHEGLLHIVESMPVHRPVPHVLARR